MKELGPRITELRERKGLSKAALSALVGVSDVTVSELLGEVPLGERDALLTKLDRMIEAAAKEGAGPLLRAAIDQPLEDVS